MSRQMSTVKYHETASAWLHSTRLSPPRSSSHPTFCDWFQRHTHSWLLQLSWTRCGLQEMGPHRSTWPRHHDAYLVFRLLDQGCRTAQGQSHIAVSSKALGMKKALPCSCWGHPQKWPYSLCWCDLIPSTNPKMPCTVWAHPEKSGSSCQASWRWCWSSAFRWSP